MTERDFVADVIAIGGGDKAAADRVFGGFAAFVNSASEAASRHPDREDVPSDGKEGKGGDQPG